MQRIDTPKPLPELVYDAVLNAVCEGTLRPGERITQDGLASRLDVSRLPVGQALKRLETEGFLCPVGRRGLRVAPLSAALVRDLYGLRAGVDLIAAGEAARRCDDRFMAEGERILADGRSALAAHDVPLLISADEEFHWLIYETAANARVLEVMATQWHHTRRVMINVIDDAANQGPIWDQHERIYRAICNGNVPEAELLAREHADGACHWLQQATERLSA
ncbi:GntR family transcriptional regulator [Arhodomonas sp. AD133]|uniref:GntR family transcriptional regulator n=1 Tax=Arhodomonas sp. AD133 TaxID=3415009 RepID=UPI003EC0D0BF